MGELDTALPDRDLTAAGEDDIHLTISGCFLTGDFYNSTTNLLACKRSDMGGLGKFHDAVVGVMAPPKPSEAPPAAEGPSAIKSLDGPKNMEIQLQGSHITGRISSATQRYRDGLTVIDESNRLEMSNVTQEAAPTVNNGVLVRLDAASRWTVTGTCYLTRLELAPGAVLDAQGGTVTMTVDGKPTEPKPGTYTGKIVLSI